VKVNFAYAGYTNAFNVVNEVKVRILFPNDQHYILTPSQNPIHTLKRTAPASLLVAATLYLLCNIAYFAAVPKSSLKTSKQLAASLFFASVFGSKNSSRALNFLIALSAFGNIISVIIGSSRVIRECGRQGVLPYPRVWASTKPFGTPLAPYVLKWGLTVLMILAPPAGDAFNFIVDLQSYPSNVFFFATTFGLLQIRKRRSRLGIEGTEFRVWNVVIAFSLAANVFILVMPWYPPPGGRFGDDVNFWYATYCVVGLAMLVSSSFLLQY
jgi:amino acid transporter